MPRIDVAGMPRSLNDSVWLTQLAEEIMGAVSGVTELGLIPKQVSVYFPADLVDDMFGEELIVCVLGLFQAPKGKPVRDEPLCSRMNMAIGQELVNFVTEHIPKCQKIEVFLADRPDVGFWQWERNNSS